MPAINITLDFDLCRKILLRLEEVLIKEMGKHSRPICVQWL